MKGHIRLLDYFGLLFGSFYLIYNFYLLKIGYLTLDSETFKLNTFFGKKISVSEIRKVIYNGDSYVVASANKKIIINQHIAEKQSLNTLIDEFKKLGLL